MIARRYQAMAAISIAVMMGCSANPGPIPDKSTAVKIGCAVIRERYGDRNCRGLVAELNGDVWTVSDEDELPPGYVGGGPIVKLSKTDGRVLDFYMTQ